MTTSTRNFNQITNLDKSYFYFFNSNFLKIKNKNFFIINLFFFNIYQNHTLVYVNYFKNFYYDRISLLFFKNFWQLKKKKLTKKFKIANFFKYLVLFFFTNSPFYYFIFFNKNLNNFFYNYYFWIEKKNLKKNNSNIIKIKNFHTDLINNFFFYFFKAVNNWLVVKNYHFVYFYFLISFFNFTYYKNTQITFKNNIFMNNFKYNLRLTNFVDLLSFNYFLL